MSEPKPKFKVGDTVVPIHTNLPEYQNKYLGTIITIKNIEIFRGRVLYHWDNPENLGFWETDVIDEPMYKSPLYKALT
jgi:hypothetical protein